jgi:hypothetical protein
MRAVLLPSSRLYITRPPMPCPVSRQTPASLTSVLLCSSVLASITNESFSPSLKMYRYQSGFLLAISRQRIFAGLKDSSALNCGRGNSPVLRTACRRAGSNPRRPFYLLPCAGFPQRAMKPSYSGNLSLAGRRLGPGLGSAVLRHRVPATLFVAFGYGCHRSGGSNGRGRAIHSVGRSRPWRGMPHGLARPRGRRAARQ